MKKTLLASALLLGGFLLGSLNNSNSIGEAKPEKAKTETVKQENNIIENENVRIEYVQVNGEIYDILVEAKGDTNLMSEFEVETPANYRSFYLIGMTKEKAAKHYDTNLSGQYEWTWEDEDYNQVPK